MLASSFSGLAARKAIGIPPVETPALFESVPGSQSGITWSHVSGRSPDYYLPETTGAGCAFVDYDNDGWMDIYLVNSGACDFFTPATPLRKCALSQQPRRYVHRRDYAEVSERATAWVLQSATITTAGIFVT